MGVTVFGSELKTDLTENTLYQHSDHIMATCIVVDDSKSDDILTKTFQALVTQIGHKSVQMHTSVGQFSEVHGQEYALIDQCNDYVSRRVE